MKRQKMANEFTLLQKIDETVTARLNIYQIERNIIVIQT